MKTFSFWLFHTMGNYLQDQGMQIIIPFLQVDEYCA
jgi:hypothetical protein